MYMYTVPGASRHDFSGYGNIAPVTTGGRVFTVAFAIVGIPFALYVYGKVGLSLDRGLARLVGKMFTNKESRKSKITR